MSKNDIQILAVAASFGFFLVLAIVLAIAGREVVAAAIIAAIAAIGSALIAWQVAKSKITTEMTVHSSIRSEEIRQFSYELIRQLRSYILGCLYVFNGIRDLQAISSGKEHLNIPDHPSLLDDPRITIYFPKHFVNNAHLLSRMSQNTQDIINIMSQIELHERILRNNRKSCAIIIVGTYHLLLFLTGLLGISAAGFSHDVDEVKEYLREVDPSSPLLRGNTSP